MIGIVEGWKKRALLATEATTDKATAYRGYKAPREQALMEGLLKPMDDAYFLFNQQSSIINPSCREIFHVMYLSLYISCRYLYY